jgi:hypothetical protein
MKPTQLLPVVLASLLGALLLWLTLAWLLDAITLPRHESTAGLLLAANIHHANVTWNCERASTLPRRTGIART